MQVDDIKDSDSLNDFILEQSIKLKAFCDAHKVTITPYQLPPEQYIKAQFEQYQNDTELKGMCIDNHLDTTDPIILQSLYEGFRAGAILDDFSKFFAHAVSEIKAYRKHHKKGLKHFEFKRVYPLSKGVCTYE